MSRLDSSAANRFRSSARSIESGDVPRICHAGRLERQRELERRLTAELHQARNLAASRPLGLDHRHHVLERQRLEVQAIGGVVVGRDRLRDCS